MSYVIAAPEALTAASQNLAGLAEAIEAAAAAAAPTTTDIVAAAADEVSAAIAKFFGGYAQQFQTLTSQAMLFHARFVRDLSTTAAAYATAEAANVGPLGALLQPLFGGTVGPNVATVGALLNFATNSVGLGGLLHFPSTVAVAGIDGVTGVEVGFSFLRIPVTGSFLGIPYGYEWPAPAFWYFPTQAGGAVNAVGITYLQHGFAAIGWFYQPLAIELAGQTNSVVVTPTIPSIPLPFGLGLGTPEMQHGVGSLFLGGQPALNAAAHWAGYHGTLPQDFVLTGHSAGGNLATLAASNYLTLGGTPGNLHGVVMFDGVASNSTAFGAAIANLQSANIPVYAVVAPPQPWNAFGATTKQLVSLYPNQFTGVEIVGGSHVDSMLGGNPLVDFAAQLLTGFSPPGATAAVYTLSTGWINDLYHGGTPAAPIYGIYGPGGPGTPYVPPGGQQSTTGPSRPP
ncbi:PE family protein [Mycobacterium intermedium]|nr:PE family protein [Mycobacterium intermedium]